MSDPISSITALILAGGRATRMDGRDKGLLFLDGRTFVEHLVSQMTPQVGSILINANRNHDAYRKTGCQVFEDTLVGFQGPLAGMLAGLQVMHTPWLITLPCDGPFVSEHYAQRMLSSAQDNNCLLVVASDGNRLQPVYALIHSSLTNSLKSYLETGGRKIDRWFAVHPYHTVSFADHQDMFININTSAEFAGLTLPPNG